MEQLYTILRELHPDVDFAQCRTLIDDGILDSIDIVTLVAEIRDAFDVEIPAGELTPENFNSAEAIRQMIERLDEA